MNTMGDQSGEKREQSAFLKVAAAAFCIGLIALLYWLTTDTSQEDPCANPQGDISGAVLADDPGDQDALVNRAIIMRGDCEE